MSNGSGAPTTTRAKRRDERREEFLDAADQAIRAEGPRVTMAGVAAAAGVTKPVLYRYVEDKNDLIEGLAVRYASRIETLLEAGTAGAGVGDPRVMIRTTIDAYLGFIESEPQIYEFLVHAAPAEAPGAAVYLQRFTAQVGDRVAAVVGAELRRNGKSDAAAVAIGHGLVGMVQSTGEWWLSSRQNGASGAGAPDVPSRETLVDQLVRVLWTGLAGLPEA